MTDSSAAWVEFGRHRLRFIDDMLYFEPHGAMSLAEVPHFLNATYALFQQYGFIYVIVDARDGKPSGASVRKFLSEDARRRETRGTTYIFGANVFVRSSAILWQNMVRLMGRPRREIYFVHSEQEAWNEIAKERAERQLFAAG